MSDARESAPPRRVLVVGANSPIALATVREFRASGAAIGGVGLDDAGSDAYDVFAVADCGDADQAREVVDRVAGAWGGLDTVVLGSAYMSAAPLEQTTDDDWRRAVSAALDAAFYVSRAASPHLAAGGAIVAISSVNAELVAPWLAAYSAAKAGVHGFTKALALEVAKKGVTVNTISPGYIGTKMVTAIPKDVLDTKILPQIPVGRLGRPEEVAGLVIYLASEEAAFVTGANIAINGGQHMQ